MLFWSNPGETVVMAYFISKDVLQQGFETFSESHDSLESKMWRSCGIRLGAAILSHQPAYKVSLLWCKL